jgi:outer membrane protein assembly factor BamB
MVAIFMNSSRKWKKIPFLKRKYRTLHIQQLNARRKIAWSFEKPGPTTLGPGEILYSCRKDAMKLSAIDSRTGKEKWEFPTKAMVRYEPCVDEDGMVYLEDGRGNLDAINASGKLLWEKNFPEGLTMPAKRGPDGLLYIETQKKGIHEIHALDAKSGKETWRAGSGSVKGEIGITDRGALYFTNHHGDVRCLDARTGNEKWSLHALLVAPFPLMTSEGYLYFGNGSDLFAYHTLEAQFRDNHKSRVEGSPDAPRKIELDDDEFLQIGGIRLTVNKEK